MFFFVVVVVAVTEFLTKSTSGIVCPGLWFQGIVYDSGEGMTIYVRQLVTLHLELGTRELNNGTQIPFSFYSV